MIWFDGFRFKFAKGPFGEGVTGGGRQARDKKKKKEPTSQREVGEATFKAVRW